MGFLIIPFLVPGFNSITNVDPTLTNFYPSSLCQYNDCFSSKNVDTPSLLAKLLFRIRSRIVSLETCLLHGGSGRGGEGRGRAGWGCGVGGAPPFVWRDFDFPAVERSRVTCA